MNDDIWHCANPDCSSTVEKPGEFCYDCNAEILRQERQDIADAEALRDMIEDKLGIHLETLEEAKQRLTDLHDITGKVIMLGDIIEFCYEEWYIVEKVDDVVGIQTYSNGWQPLPKDRAKEYTIIGNVVDNPDIAEKCPKRG